MLRSQNMSMQRLGTVLVTVDIEKRLNSQINALSNKLSELYFIIMKRLSTRAVKQPRS